MIGYGGTTLNVDNEFGIESLLVEFHRFEGAYYRLQTTQYKLIR